MRLAHVIVQHKGDIRKPRQQATLVGLSPEKINLISYGSMAHVSNITLIRTDTTLDLSQKAEKGLPYSDLGQNCYTHIASPSGYWRRIES